MPEPPTPGVNGHVVGSPALHASMSMLSFEPAASTFSCAASIAIAGSFCLFCENGADGLPTVTSRSPVTASAPGTARIAAQAMMQQAAASDRSIRLLLILSPLSECTKRYLLRAARIASFGEGHVGRAHEPRLDAMAMLQTLVRLDRGYVAVAGPDAPDFLERMLSNEVASLEPGREARPALLLTP